MIEGTLTSMNGHVSDLIVVNTIMGDRPVNGSRGIGNIREAKTLWFAQTLEETAHNKTTSRASTKC